MRQLPLLLPQDGVSFEVRRYDAAKFAVVSSEGRTFDQVTGELTRRLLMYIGGSNEQGNWWRLECGFYQSHWSQACHVANDVTVTALHLPR